MVITHGLIVNFWMNIKSSCCVYQCVQEISWQSILFISTLEISFGQNITVKVNCTIISSANIFKNVAFGHVHYIQPSDHLCQDNFNVIKVHQRLIIRWFGEVTGGLILSCVQHYQLLRFFVTMTVEQQRSLQTEIILNESFTFFCVQFSSVSCQIG
ncbi:Hypothetical_protein [Hexamita inflata]|uniref:Hypothetical_protein n=1 Tax=Hexamita inflata TaxID=28002 RepID=A0AA86UYJ2_9EUKA|nr:Hypothetical protein HINF_LOCUS57257 [Hexamita inflata]